MISFSHIAYFGSLVSVLTISEGHGKSISPLDGIWYAAGRTATSVTGDIFIEKNELIIDHKVTLFLGEPRIIPEYKTLFGEAITVTAYPVHGRSDIPLINGNVLCKQPAKWAIFRLESRTELSMRLAQSDDLTSDHTIKSCGLYGYTRGAVRFS